MLIDIPDSTYSAALHFPSKQDMQLRGCRVKVRQVRLHVNRGSPSFTPTPYGLSERVMPSIASQFMRYFVKISNSPQDLSLSAMVRASRLSVSLDRYLRRLFFLAANYTMEHEPRLSITPATKPIKIQSETTDLSEPNREETQRHGDLDIQASSTLDTIATHYDIDAFEDEVLCVF